MNPKALSSYAITLANSIRSFALDRLLVGQLQLVSRLPARDAMCMDMYAEPYIDHHEQIGITVNLMIGPNSLLVSVFTLCRSVFLYFEAGRCVKCNSCAEDELHPLHSF